jgi:hypothetical protein
MSGLVDLGDQLTIEVRPIVSGLSEGDPAPP